jgi:hypothetical protein
MSKPLPTYRERTNFDLSHVPAETGECIVCGVALLRGERTACERCRSLAEQALRDPTALERLRAMAYAD